MSTDRLSCQFPVAGVLDLTEQLINNTQTNSWKYIKTKETNCTDCASERDPETNLIKV